MKERAREDGERKDRVKKMVEERVEQEEKEKGGAKGKRGASTVDPGLLGDEDEGFGVSVESMDVDGAQTRSKGTKRAAFWSR